MSETRTPVMVDVDTGEVIPMNMTMAEAIGAHETIKEMVSKEYDEREAEKELIKAHDKDHKSPYKVWAQLNLTGDIKELLWLASEHPKAMSVLLFILKHMDGYNALVCSHQVIQDALCVSQPTVTRAIKLLKECNFIKVAKSGTSNVYYVNADVAWKSWGKNTQYAEFSAKVMIAGSEQDDYKTDVKAKKIATITNTK